ncbi:MAG: hypothetical protein MZW92_76925 [Comamonadaceae bacterium]|nr:hypothetical protein [Comamonadaceae bacterium]
MPRLVDHACQKKGSTDLRRDGVVGKATVDQVREGPNREHRGALHVPPPLQRRKLFPRRLPAPRNGCAARE